MKVSDLSYYEVLSRLALIESHLGYDAMCFYDPIYTTYNGGDGLLNAQKEASQMMKHVGLTHHIPVITFTKTEQSVGGNIALDNSENVFIEINENYRNHPAQVRAVMAHEICHKVLFINGLYYSEKTKDLENEFLTDLATVYVGFGKLSLNGCYNERQTVEYSDVGKKTTTHKESIGYLSLSTFATAYYIVCTRFNVAPSDRILGLNKFASNEINKIHLIQRNNLKTEDLIETLKTAQNTVSTTYKYIIVLEKILSQIKEKAREKHIGIHNDLVLPFNYDDEKLSRQQLLALNAISLYHNADDDFPVINEILSEFVNHIGDKSSIDFDEICQTLKDLECPICGFKKTNALQENKKALFRCKKCNHLFVWDGELQLKMQNAVENDNNFISEDELQPKKKKGFFFKLFKRCK